MSLKSLKAAEKFAKEFIEIKEFFSKVGFEVLGTKINSDETIYFIKKKESS